MTIRRELFFCLQKILNILNWHMECTYNVLRSNLVRTTNAWQNTLPIVSEYRPQLFEMKNGLFGLFANKCVPCGSLRFVLGVSMTKKFNVKSCDFRFRPLELWEGKQCLTTANCFAREFVFRISISCYLNNNGESISSETKHFQLFILHFPFPFYESNPEIERIISEDENRRWKS